MSVQECVHVKEETVKVEVFLCDMDKLPKPSAAAPFSVISILLMSSRSGKCGKLNL